MHCCSLTHFPSDLSCSHLSGAKQRSCCRMDQFCTLQMPSLVQFRHGFRHCASQLHSMKEEFCGLSLRGTVRSMQGRLQCCARHRWCSCSGSIGSCDLTSLSSVTERIKKSPECAGSWQTEQDMDRGWTKRRTEDEKVCR